VYGAIAANIAIAATKFVVAGITGSSAMVSEGIHSAVDTGNGALLLVGSRLSEREATVEHPFGHGKELYFWSLIVAVLIFGVGGGLSAYQGFVHVLHREPLKSAFWNYVVLAAAALFEGTSLMIALREFLREKGTRPFWEALHGSKDPTTYTVLAEDSAALVGLGVAAVGIFVTDRFGVPQADGAASIVIGAAARPHRRAADPRGARAPDRRRPAPRHAGRHPRDGERACAGAARRAPPSMYIGPTKCCSRSTCSSRPMRPATDGRRGHQHAGVAHPRALSAHQPHLHRAARDRGRRAAAGAGPGVRRRPGRQPSRHRTAPGSARLPERTHARGEIHGLRARPCAAPGPGSRASCTGHAAHSKCPSSASGMKRVRLAYTWRSPPRLLRHVEALRHQQRELVLRARHRHVQQPPLLLDLGLRAGRQSDGMQPSTTLSTCTASTPGPSPSGSWTG
jgi:hypothetical protein